MRRANPIAFRSRDFCATRAYSSAGRVGFTLCRARKSAEINGAKNHTAQTARRFRFQHPPFVYSDDQSITACLASIFYVLFARRQLSFLASVDPPANFDDSRIRNASFLPRPLAIVLALLELVSSTCSREDEWREIGERIWCFELAAKVLGFRLHQLARLLPADPAAAIIDRASSPYHSRQRFVRSRDGTGPLPYVTFSFHLSTANLRERLDLEFNSEGIGNSLAPDAKRLRTSSLSERTAGLLLSGGDSWGDRLEAKSRCASEGEVS